MESIRRWIPLLPALGLLPGILLGASQAAKQSTEYTRDVSGHVVAGSSWVEVSTPSSYQRTLQRVSLNGRLVPQESVSQQVVYEDSSKKTVERTTQLYDNDGKPLQSAKDQIQVLKRPDGTQSVVTLTSVQDVNGRFQLSKRTAAEVRPTAAGSQSTTVVEVPDLQGGMTVVQKIESLESKSPSGEQRQVVVYQKDVNGRFYEGSRQVTERIEGKGAVSETVTGFEADASGRLRPANRTVTTIRTLADGSETRESTVYRGYTAGRVDPGEQAKFYLSEQILVERKPGPGGSMIETTSVRTPSPDFPHDLGKPTPMSTVVCTGQCTQPGTTK